MIWFNTDFDLPMLNALSSGTLGDTLGIEFSEFGDDYLIAKMPVDARTKQPMGLLHGGASAALAETVGSVAALLCIDRTKYACVGLDINCNHVRGKKEGWVYATAKPFHLGKTTHVWEILIKDEKQKLICVSRLTMAVIKNI